MYQLQVIEFQNQRVLTTTQLAESYGADRQQISKNFTRNQGRYKLGKHYYALTGKEKIEFLNHVQIDDGSKNASILYLWTEKGAWLHAKSLNTDEAWGAYEKLVDDYYRIKQQSIDTSLLSPELQMFKQLWDGLAKQQIEQAETKRLAQEANKKAEQAEQAINEIKDTFLQSDEDWRKSINAMLNRAAFKLGGNYRDLRNKSYEMLEHRGRCDLNRRLRYLLDRLEQNGATKTQINKTSKMDVIESDVRLKEIYSTIVKELSIGSLGIIS